MAYEKSYTVMEARRIINTSEGKWVDKVGTRRVATTDKQKKLSAHAQARHLLPGNKAGNMMTGTDNTTVTDMEERFDDVAKRTGAFKNLMEMVLPVSNFLNSDFGQATLHELDLGAKAVFATFKCEGLFGIDQTETSYTPHPLAGMPTIQRDTVGSTKSGAMNVLNIKIVATNSNELHIQTAFAGSEKIQNSTYEAYYKGTPNIIGTQLLQNNFAKSIQRR